MASLISVIIPVFDDLKGLITTITSLRSQVFDGPFDIIVVNDGADPKIYQYCNQEGIDCLDISPNAGSYNARNQAVLKAKTEYLAFLDADSTASSGWLASGLRMLSHYDYIAGNVTIPENLVTDIATFHDSVTAFPIERYFEVLHFGVTANLFVRKEVFESIGLFDSDLRSGGDIEFGDRVYRAGKFKQAYSGDSIVYHPPRTHREKVEKLLRVSVGQRLLKSKYPERFENLNGSESVIKTIRNVLPPSLSKVKKLYKQHPRYSIIAFYLYSYRLKLSFFFERIRY